MYYNTTISDLKAYDQHLNMVLEDVEEVVTSREIDEETFEEIVKVCIIPFSLKARKRKEPFPYYLLEATE